MIKPMLEQLEVSLPLDISAASWEDPVLLLEGFGWTLSATSAWRIVLEDAVIAACWDKNPEDIVQSLVGQKIVSVDVQSTTVAVDPVFGISNGSKLEIFSTDTFEPWVMHLPNGVFVASPSNPAAFS